MAQANHPWLKLLLGVSICALSVMALGITQSDFNATWSALNPFRTERALRVLIIGDSIALGEMDRDLRNIRYDENRDQPILGLIPRVRSALPEIEIHAIGFEGKSSLRIMEHLERTLATSSTARERLANADIIIFQGGLNDYWDRVAPRSTALRVRTCAVKLKTLAPQAAVYVASLVPPANTQHNQWVFQYHRVLFSNSLKNLVVGPRFDSIPLTDLSKDGIHPSTSGYDKLGEILVRFICDRFSDERNNRDEVDLITPQQCRSH